MGNKQTNIKAEGLSSTHPALRNARIITENNRRYTQAKFKVQNDQYDEWYKQLQSGRKQIKSEYLLLPDTTNYKQDQGLCGNSGTLTNTYPYFPYQLSEMIAQRKQEGGYFKESQLWYILYALAVAKADTKGYTPKLGDIKPENIFADDQGIIKIANVLSWPNEHPSYIKALDLQPGFFTGFLAPEDLIELQKGSFDNQKNRYSQVFAIGATIINTGILDNMVDIYDYQTRTFREPVFLTKKISWAQSQWYSDIFKSVILNLVHKNPTERVTPEELRDFVVLFKDHILEKRQFTVTSVPSKIARSYDAYLHKML